MFHVFIDSKVNEGLANSFIECFMDNCQCVTDKTNPDVIIEIIHFTAMIVEK